MHTKVKHTYANITSECVQLNLFNKKISTRYTFECLSTLRSSKGPFEHEHLSLKLPFTNNLNMWFAHEISQSINRESLHAELNPRSRGSIGDQIRRSTKPPIKIPKRNRPKISHSAVSIWRPGRRLNRRIKPENNKCIRSNSAVSIRRPDRRS